MVESGGIAVSLGAGARSGGRELSIGLGITAKLPKGYPEVVVDVSVVRIDAQRSPKFLNGLGKPAGLRQRNPIIIMSLGIPRPKADRFGNLQDRLWESALAGQRQA
jgi:hypothetical protein